MYRPNEAEWVSVLSEHKNNTALQRRLKYRFAVDHNPYKEAIRCLWMKRAEDLSRLVVDAYPWRDKMAMRDEAQRNIELYFSSHTSFDDTNIDPFFPDLSRRISDIRRAHPLTDFLHTTRSNVAFAIDCHTLMDTYSERFARLFASIFDVTCS